MDGDRNEKMIKKKRDKKIREKGRWIDFKTRGTRWVTCSIKGWIASTHSHCVLSEEALDISFAIAYGPDFWGLLISGGLPPVEVVRVRNLGNASSLREDPSISTSRIKDHIKKLRWGTDGYLSDVSHGPMVFYFHSHGAIRGGQEDPSQTSIEVVECTESKLIKCRKIISLKERITFARWLGSWKKKKKSGTPISSASQLRGVQVFTK